MSAKQINDGWFVVDANGDDYDGPYNSRADAERAAQDFETWHHVINQEEQTP